MSDNVITIRVDDELFEKIKARGGSVSEEVRNTLLSAYGLDKRDERDKARIDRIISEAKSGVVTSGDDKFLIPVGDVICKDTKPQTQLWWCPVERLAYLKELCAPWKGFMLHIGKDGGGTWYQPEVIEDSEQERRRGGRFCRSCRGVSALESDRLVWLEITRPDVAIAYMSEHTDIPCAVRCDVHKYSEDTMYKEAFDTANELFIYYAVNNRPMRLKSAPLSTSDIDKMYDL